MALETLKDVKEIGGFKVTNNPDDPIGPIFIHDNAISFVLQKGSVKENGVNGCRVDTIIEAALLMVEGLEEKDPCLENEAVIYHLSVAIENLAKRRFDREKRRVEEKSKT
jgi:hypothetical protein